MWNRVPKLGVELSNETFDEPVAVHRIIHDLLHGFADRQEVLTLLILDKKRFIFSDMSEQAEDL